MKELTKRLLKYIDIIQNMNLRSSKVLQGLFAGMHKSPYLGFSADFEDHREYNPGDNIKLINWPLWGRTEKLFIKRFKEDTNTTVHILLDSTASMDYGKGSDNKYFRGLEFAALLYLLFSRQNDRVVLTTFSDSLHPVYSSSQKKEPGRFMEALNSLKTHGGMNFYESMKQFTSRVKRRSIIVLISDMIFREDDLRKGLGALSYFGHDIVLLQTLTEYELGIKDLESGYYYDPEDTAKRTYSDGVGAKKVLVEWQKKIEWICRDLSVKRILIPTSSDPLKALLALSQGVNDGFS